ncbi:MAG: hypothetical protein ACLU9S_16230 [Oscillospiraceae bacterium]
MSSNHADYDRQQDRPSKVKAADIVGGVDISSGKGNRPRGGAAGISPRCP